MVTLTQASKLRSTLETACHAAGFVPRIAAETSDLGVVAELAAEQVGVAVLPASGLDGAADLVQLGLTHPTHDRRILLVWRPATTPTAARAFLTLAREHLTPARKPPDRPRPATALGASLERSSLACSGARCTGSNPATRQPCGLPGDAVGNTIRRRRQERRDEARTGSYAQPSGGEPAPRKQRVFGDLASRWASNPITFSD